MKHNFPALLAGTLALLEVGPLQREADFVKLFTSLLEWYDNWLSDGKAPTLV